MTPFPDRHPLLAPLAALPAAAWAALPGSDAPMAMSRLDLAPLAGPLAPPQLAAILGPAELARYHAFPFPKRQQEWLGGRLAAKEAVRELLVALGRKPRAAAALVIASDPAGRPLLETAGLPHPIHLSISHSHGQAAALAGLSPCGIDLQLCTPTVIRVRERFATAAESAILRAALAGLTERERLTLLWAAKEALRKMVPTRPLLGFHEALLTEIRPAGIAHLFLFSAGKICHNASHPVRVVATVVGEHALAVSVLPPTE